MGFWSGSDHMQVVTLRPRAGGGRVRRRVAETLDVPGLGSVHLVDEDAGLSVCGLYQGRQLTRLDRPFEEWLADYRCPLCARQHRAS